VVKSNGVWREKGSETTEYREVNDNEWLRV
jgi:hypothetical protein